MRNLHVWKCRTEDGEKREVRAEKFGKKWKVQAKVASADHWTYYDPPLLEDLVHLREDHLASGWFKAATRLNRLICHTLLRMPIRRLSKPLIGELMKPVISGAGWP